MRKRYLLLLALLLSLTSCLPPRFLPPEKPEPEFIINQLKIRAQKILGLKGLAYMQIDSRGRSLRTEQILFLRRPAWLRAESLSPLGIPQFYLVTNGEDLRIYNPGENKYYIGPANSRHLAILLPEIRSLAEMVAFLLSVPPLIEHETAILHKSSKDSLWILELRNNSTAQRQLLWVDPINFYIKQTELYAGELIYNLIFSTYQPFGQEFFPKKIQYASPHCEIRVEYKDIVLNPSWEKEDFLLPIPRGAQIIFLD